MTYIVREDPSGRAVKCVGCATSLTGIAVSNPARGHGCLSCECCVLSGRGLCDGLVTRPVESYRVCVSECDREASIMRRSWLTTAVVPWKRNTVRELGISFCTALDS
jgi:hypothetical protein